MEYEYIIFAKVTSGISSGRLRKRWATKVVLPVFTDPTTKALKVWVSRTGHPKHAMVLFLIDIRYLYALFRACRQVHMYNKFT
jgi:hypothetical protein